MAVGLLSVRGSPNAIQLVGANNYGPSTVGSAAITAVNATQIVTRHPFVIGSGDASQIILSFFAWYLKKLVGATALGNGFTVTSCAVEFNSTYRAVTFNGSRSLTISDGDTDIQSDPVFAAQFGLSSFTQGSIGYVRMLCSFSAAQTDSLPINSYAFLTTTASQVLFDPLKCSITNSVDSTGAITFSMTNGGTNGVDALAPAGFFTPIVLGRFVTSGRKPSFVITGDSVSLGALEQTSNASFVAGYSRFLFPNGVADPTGAIAGLNLSCAGGLASDWAGGTPSKLTAYLGYAKYGMETYGANGGTVADSVAINVQMRAASLSHIYRFSLTPFTSSSNSWSDAAGQTTHTGYSNGGAVGTFHTSLKALAASDYDFLDPLGERDQSGAGDYWKWYTNGVNLYAVRSDGLHPQSAGYELMAAGDTTQTASGGASTINLRTFFAALT